MGVAIIIPDVNFADENLGKVTLTENVSVSELYIIAPSTIVDNTYQLEVSYKPSSTNQRRVTWSIESGSNYAEIDANTGKLTIKSSANNSNVTIKATSTFNPSVFATKNLILTYSNYNIFTECTMRLPLTTDANDVVSGIISEDVINVTFDNVNGAKFTGNHKGGIKIPCTAKVKTFYAEIYISSEQLSNEFAYLFAIGDESHQIDFSLLYNTKNGTMGCSWYNDYFSTSTVQRDMFHKFCINKKEEGNWELYVDGTKLFTASGLTPSPESPIDGLFLGTNPRAYYGGNNRTPDCYMKNVCVWDRILTEQECIYITE